MRAALPRFLAPALGCCLAVDNPGLLHRFAALSGSGGTLPLVGLGWSSALLGLDCAFLASGGATAGLRGLLRSLDYAFWGCGRLATWAFVLGFCETAQSR